MFRFKIYFFLFFNWGVLKVISLIKLSFFKLFYLVYQKFLSVHFYLKILINHRIFCILGAGEKIHVTSRWIKIAWCGTRFYVSKAHFCAFQSWGTKCLQGLLSLKNVKLIGRIPLKTIITHREEFEIKREKGLYSTKVKFAVQRFLSKSDSKTEKKPSTTVLQNKLQVQLHCLRI